MNQTELCLQTQRELNGERGSRTELGVGLGAGELSAFSAAPVDQLNKGKKWSVYLCVCVYTQTYTHMYGLP